MDFFEVAQTRRSVRAFKPDPIPDEVFERVVEAARGAPSANNVQPWRLLAVKDESTRREIARLCFEQDFIAQAPVVCVICAERYVDSYSWLAERMYLVDTAIFIDHLALAARAEGLGTCWIGAFDDERHAGLRRLLAVPDTRDVVMVMPMGYPLLDDAFRPTRARKPLHAILSFETFADD